ncbi:Allantoate permease [Komagataella phaffii CBS 7435]|uniref:Allantoin permease n=2 Tax=Komagataella phaffii TaxID=460519 RepID=C4QWV7_KOMPG|nr:Allantoin permease [Komagataella phaffii GS115]AOA61286.1 GQ67_02937T0 [Komagataella phaffii]CAH2446523.1 Allantoate permease [Komagataella phaffii CBS 7435]AOA65390.1 GQ68_02310T0 [Komagataella phaffii GS115]CAY67730.1 Allantoin permease [Komagataella phaffii GS115]CCA36817.1 Allantoate permease [Komagataella phaffii CBS 7435]
MSDLSAKRTSVEHLEDMGSLASDEKHVDRVHAEKVDKDILQYMDEEAVEIDAETDRRLFWMINRRILPVMVGTYFLQALDKGTLSFASIMGIREDSNLVGQQYSWLTTCTYLAVLVWEYPTNWLIQRLPIAKYLCFNIFAWGVVLGFHALGHNFGALVVVRTLLGLFECCCQPCFIVMSSMWYKRDEQATIVALWYMMNGGQQIVGGVLAYCFTLITGASLKNWQILFLVYGCITVVWGVFVLIWTPDSPMAAKCWSEEDKKLMVERVRSNQTGLQNRKLKRYQVVEALKDPQTYCYFLIQFLTSLPTSGLGAFANIIISSFGFTVLETQLLAMVLGAYLIILLLSSAWLTKRFNQNIFFMIGYVIPSIIGTVVLMTVTIDGYDTDSYDYKLRRGVLLFCYYLTLSFWGVANLGLSLLSRNIAGQSKKSFCTAFNFVGWAVGNCVGPQVFRAQDAPRYLTAFGTHMGCYAALITLLVFMRLWLMRENYRKEKMIERGEALRDEHLKHAFEDLTDRENVNFRYAY